MSWQDLTVFYKLCSVANIKTFPKISIIYKNHTKKTNMKEYANPQVLKKANKALALVIIPWHTLYRTKRKCRTKLILFDEHNIFFDSCAKQLDDDHENEIAMILLFLYVTYL